MISLTTPEEHGRLLAAAHGIQQIADHINETKRRKDLVDMIASGDTKTESRVGKTNHVCKECGIKKKKKRNIVTFMRMCVRERVRYKSIST